MSATRRVVVTGAFPQDALRALESEGFDLTVLPGETDEEGVVRAAEGAWGLVHGGVGYLSRSTWERLPDLAVVVVMATGYRSFIEPPLAGQGPRVTYTPHANAVAVAEFALAQLLDLARGISRQVAEVAGGEWREVPSASLVGARLGIVGMGHIGREVARMAHAAFGTEIHYWNRTRRPELEALPYTAAADLPELFDAVDFVSISVDHDPGKNTGLIGAELLKRLGADGLLVNVSRAALVDPVALRTALAEGWIAGAAIDGYYAEPAPGPDADPHGLLEFVPGRLLVTPHNAFHSHQAVGAMAEMALGNLRAVAQGATPPYPVPAATA
jgi:phosphoglycerate dehydrogenase-like enzyme